MDTISQIQSVHLNESTLCQQAYLPGSSSLVIAGESLAQVEVVKRLEQSIIRPIAVSAVRKVLQER